MNKGSKITNTTTTVTMNELFSGIGAQRKALERIGIPHEVVGISEIDKYAIQSYEAIFGKTRNYGDISKVERLDYADLWTYSFPCQDVSISGKQRGINEGTRSGLLYQVQRLLEVAKDEGTLPKYLLLENVKNLVGKKFKGEFDNWLNYLEGLGYNTYWEVLNAKNYGVPQNRERVFAISIRKDLKEDFKFPPKEELKIKLKDILEEKVDEKYYLSNEKVEKFIENSGYKEVQQDNYVLESKILRIDGNLYPNSGNPQAGRVYKSEGISPALDTCQGGNRMPKIIELGYYAYPNSDKKHQSNTVYSAEGLAPTLDTMQGGNRQPKILSEGLRIRKLTPLECWRLMGFDDEDFKKAKNSGVSNSQLYKQAGNSIVVDVLEGIFRELLK